MTELDSPRRVRPMRGWRWIVEGVQLVLKKPITFVTFFLMIWLALLVATQNQLLLIAVQLLLPAMLAGGFRICAAVDQGRAVPANMLTSGFRVRFRELLVLGGLFLACNVIALLATIVLGGPELVRAMANPESVTPEMREILEPRLRMATLLAMVLILPLQLALWFAPSSTALSDTPVTKSLRHSLLAVARNLLPFLVYGVAIFVFTFVLFSILNRLGLPGSKSMFATVSFLVPAMVPTIYASYKDLLTDSARATP